MGHYGALIKNKNKNFLKDFIIKKYMSEDDYNNLEDKLILKFPDFYAITNNPWKALKAGNYEQFMLEVFNKYLQEEDFKLKVLYIDCHINDLDELFIRGIWNKSDTPIFHHNFENYNENILFNLDECKFFTKIKTENNMNLCNVFNNLIEENENVYLWMKF